MQFDAEAVNMVVSLESLEWTVEFVEWTSSTNDECMRRARESAPEGTIIVAGHQTAGQGRQGRVWVDRPGQALLFSMLLRPTIPAAEYAYLPLLAGVAVVEGLRILTGRTFGTKWPNDVVFAGDKICGILCQADINAGHAVVGIGINVLGDGDALPASAATVESVTGQQITREELLISILRDFGRRYRAARNQGWDAVLAAYRRTDTIVGRDLEFTIGNQHGAGRATAIDDNGGLVIETEDGSITAHAGEIHLRK